MLKNCQDEGSPKLFLLWDVTKIYSWKDQFVSYGFAGALERDMES